MAENFLIIGPYSTNPLAFVTRPFWAKGNSPDLHTLKETKHDKIT